MSAQRRRKRSARRRARPAPTEKAKQNVKDALTEVENAVKALRADIEQLRKKIIILDCDDGMIRRRGSRRS